MRIRDDALSWTQCTREWWEVEEEAVREEAEQGPNPFSHSCRYARMCKDHVDWELLNLALGSTLKEISRRSTGCPTPVSCRVHSFDGRKEK